MSKLVLSLLLIIAALQYRLWLGDGGVREYHETLQKIDDLQQEGERRKVRNAAVAADVKDLREGVDAIEERARYDLGMVRPDETFVQVFETPQPQHETPDEPAERKPSARQRRPERSKHQAPPARPEARAGQAASDTSHRAAPAASRSKPSRPAHRP